MHSVCYVHRFESSISLRDIVRNFGSFMVASLGEISTYANFKIKITKYEHSARPEHHSENRY